MAWPILGSRTAKEQTLKATQRMDTSHSNSLTARQTFLTNRLPT